LPVGKFEDAAATLGHPQWNDDLLERDIEEALSTIHGRSDQEE
jgi:hypothetical protein